MGELSTLPQTPLSTGKGDPPHNSPNSAPSAPQFPRGAKGALMSPTF